MKEQTRIPWRGLLAVLAVSSGLAIDARAELRVIKPAGGTIAAGSDYQVLWQSSVPLPEVDLTLMQQQRAIGATVRLRGRREADYWTGNWQVPATVAEGLYHIRLQNPRAREQAVSRLFRIGGGRPGPGDAASGTITLTGFPTTGETLFATHERRLSWRAPQASLRYRVRLMRHSQHVNHLTSDQGATGSFNWTVGRNYAPDEPTPPAGMGYQLVVESMDGSVRQISPAFAIQWPTLQLLEPVATGSIRGDRQNPVRWTSRNLQGGVRLSIELRTNLRRTTVDLGSGEDSGSVAVRWMEAYNTRRNNWETGTGRIIVHSVRAPAIHASTPQFSTGNTSMPSER